MLTVFKLVLNVIPQDISSTVLLSHAITKIYWCNNLIKIHSFLLCNINKIIFCTIIFESKIFPLRNRNRNVTT